MAENLPYGKIYNEYGLTEASGPTVSVAKHEMAISKAPSVGQSFINTDIRIMDESGHECEMGQVGEITVKGDQVMKEYLHDPDTTAATLRDGWLYTGDLGRWMTKGSCMWWIGKKISS